MGKAKVTVVEGEGIMAQARKKSMSRAKKAGLVFPVSRISRHMRDMKRSKRIGAGASVYMAAVLEYAAAELLESAGGALGKRKRITPTDVMRAIRNDEELHQLLGGCTVFVGEKIKNVSKAVTLAKEGAEEA